jgi:hypothetical protein
VEVAEAQERRDRVRTVFWIQVGHVARLVGLSLLPCPFGAAAFVLVPALSRLLKEPSQVELQMPSLLEPVVGRQALVDQKSGWKRPWSGIAGSIRPLVKGGQVIKVFLLPLLSIGIVRSCAMSKGGCVTHIISRPPGIYLYNLTVIGKGLQRWAVHVGRKQDPWT